MKEEKAATSASNQVTSSENSQKTLHWMQSSLAEMKAEMSDLNRALNVSRQLQLQQETASQWNLLRRDLSAIQATVADTVAHQQTQTQSAQLIRRDVDDMQQQHSSQVAHLNQLDQDVSQRLACYAAIGCHLADATQTTDVATNQIFDGRPISPEKKNKIDSRQPEFFFFFYDENGSGQSKDR